jgi:hypothetical protein
MSYKLADGSMSTDYKIGDRFYITEGLDKGRIATLVEDDGSSLPWFDKGGVDRNCEFWEGLNPCTKENNGRVIDALRDQIKKIERTIKELES